MAHHLTGWQRQGLGKRCSHRGFTLFELLVVIALILFLTRLTLFQYSSVPQQKKLEGATKALGFYFNSASQIAQSAKKWTALVANADKDTDGYLRQFGIYTWFQGNEPYEDTDGDGTYSGSEEFLDINGNNAYDIQVSGWKVEDTKGHFLPDKIFLDLERSGAASFKSDIFETKEKHFSTEKYNYFSIEHDKDVGPDPKDAIEVGRLPYFLNRESFAAATAKSGTYQPLASGNGNTDDEDKPLYEKEKAFSETKNAAKWLYFLFDPKGRYINIESPLVKGSPDEDAQRDLIVLSLGVLNPQGPASSQHKVRPLTGKADVIRAAFILHRSGTYTLLEDDAQIPTP